MMSSHFLRITAMMLLTAALCTPPAAAAAAAQVEGGPVVAASDSAGVSPEPFLNPDGTVNLKAGQSGALDLDGWEVQIDPERGPIFAAQAEADPEPMAVPVGEWAAVGAGGGAPINDQVSTAIVYNGDFVIGGAFHDAGGNRAADYLALWNGSSWDSFGATSLGDGALSGPIMALAVAGDYLYAGGWFNYIIDGTNYLPAARYVARWDGSAWSALGHGATANDGSLNNSVKALAVDSAGKLYVGGYFYNVQNGSTTLTAADYIAVWDGTDWWALGNNGAPQDGSLNGCAMAIVIDAADRVYAGGYFQDVNDYGTVNDAADYIAMWDGSNWTSLGQNNSSGEGSLNGSVHALAFGEKVLYVGGTFSEVVDGDTNVPEADYLATWTGGHWNHLGSGGAGHSAFNDRVQAIAVGAAGIYVGGQFTDASNEGTPMPGADYIAYWNGTRWLPVGGTAAGDGPLYEGYVYALAVIPGALGEIVVAGGTFAGARNAGGTVPQAANAARRSGANWAAMGSGEGSVTDVVRALAVNGTDVYVGGHFSNVVDGSTALPEADFVARWDGSSWHSLGSDGAGGGSLHAAVYALAVDGDDVYVGGEFCGVNDEGVAIYAACNIAKWNAVDGWSALGHGAEADSIAVGGPVYALAAQGGIVYAGGYFTDVNNKGDVLEAADYIAKWDGSDWSALGGGGPDGGAITGGVAAIALSGTDVYAGGSFQNVYRSDGSQMAAADSIAKWDGSSWSALGAGIGGNGAFAGSIDAILVSGNTVYAGGNFVSVANGSHVIHTASQVASWDGQYWSAVGSGKWDHSSLNSTVYALAMHNGTLYAGGQFYDAENGYTTETAADYIAAWDGLEWKPLGDNGAPGEGSLGGAGTGIWALGLSGNTLYVGGNFMDVNNSGTVLDYADHLAAFGLAPESAIQVTVGGTSQGSYVLPPGGSQRQSYPDLNDGPVEIMENGGKPIIASARINLKTSPTYSSYGEFMGLPVSQLSDTYIFPWYNNGATSGLDSQLRFGNVGTQPTTVYVTIGGVGKGSYPLDPNESLRVTYPDLNDGPVQVNSSDDVPIIASIRINLKKHPTMSSYTEFLGISSGTVKGTAYMFPWYNNGASSGLDSQVRFGNVGSGSTVVTVKVGGALRGTYALGPNESLRVTYPDLNNGSVTISSDDEVPIIASMRVNLKKSPSYMSYAEFMGLSTPPETSYIFPWYNNGVTSGLDSQLRFANVGTSPTDVTVKIAGTDYGPYSLDQDEGMKVSYYDLNDGPVIVSSSDDVPIIASIRINLKKSPTYSSYAEFLGMSIGLPLDFPGNNMSPLYVLPWYNNGAASGLDSQLRFGLP